MNPRPIVTVTVQARGVRSGDRLWDGHRLRAITRVDYAPDLQGWVEFHFGLNTKPERLACNAVVQLAHAFRDAYGVWTADRKLSPVVTQWAHTTPQDSP